MAGRGKIAQMVEDEAAKAEAEEPDVEEEAADAETPSDPDPTPDEEPDDAPSSEAALAAFEKEVQRHGVELAAIMGEDFTAWHLCEYCSGIGYSPTPQPKPDPDTETCGRCSGLGFMLTGATAELTTTRACTACQGQGFTVRVKYPEVPVAAQQGAAPVPRFDPYTGELIPENGAGVPVGGWAPGYSPGGQPAR